jgi:hypothetical protein
LPRPCWLRPITLLMTVILGASGASTDRALRGFRLNVTDPSALPHSDRFAPLQSLALKTVPQRLCEAVAYHKPRLRGATEGGCPRGMERAWCRTGAALAGGTGRCRTGAILAGRCGIASQGGCPNGKGRACTAWRLPSRGWGGLVPHGGCPRGKELAGAARRLPSWGRAGLRRIGTALAGRNRLASHGGRPCGKEQACVARGLPLRERCGLLPQGDCPRGRGRDGVTWGLPSLEGTGRCRMRAALAEGAGLPRTGLPRGNGRACTAWVLCPCGEERTRRCMRATLAKGADSCRMGGCPRVVGRGYAVWGLPSRKGPPLRKGADWCCVGGGDCLREWRASAAWGLPSRDGRACATRGLPSREGRADVARELLSREWQAGATQGLALAGKGRVGAA